LRETREITDCEFEAMVTIKQLRYLIAIADQLHFRRAAEFMHVSQPTISGQLRSMEINLGVQLVERTRTRVLLTPIGKSIADRGRIILSEVEQIADLAKHGLNPLDGTFRLGILSTLGPYLLPHILPALHAKYPNLRLYIREGMPDALVHDLEDGKLDLLLFPLPIRRREIESVPLFREPLLVVVPKDHRIAAKKSVRRDDLRNETVLALARGYRLHDQVHDLCEDFNANLSIDFEGTSLDTLRQMVSMGLGISFLPMLYVLAETEDDESVAVRPIDRSPPSRTIGMAWRKQSSHQKEYEALANFICATLEDIPGIMALR
jgi:LysR family transcriptional regulator, hydrogen peroxide-inducible genes activator